MSFFMKLGATPTAPAPAPVLPPDAPKSDPALAAAPVEDFDAFPPPRRQLIAEPSAEVKADLQKFDAAVERIETEKKAKEVMAAANAAAIEDDKAAMGITTEPAPKKRGRPPGSKNKTKISDINLSEPVSKARAFEISAKLSNMKVLNPVSEERAKEIDAEIVADMGPNPREAVTVKSVTVSKGFTVNLGSFNSVRFDVSVTGEGSDLELVYSTLMGEIEERLNAEAAKYESEVDQKNKTMKPAQEVVCK